MRTGLSGNAALWTQENVAVSADYDSPWKEALDAYFEAFLALLFPAVHTLIDWSRDYESLDKEFQQVVREAELGRRYVDKLVKVWTTAGVERWVLIHIEVQTARESDFPLRMYVYNYRIFDRYNKPVASLAVLAGDDPNWRLAEFRESVFGHGLRRREVAGDSQSPRNRDQPRRSAPALVAGRFVTIMHPAPSQRLARHRRPRYSSVWSASIARPALSASIGIRK
jgi:hypothetical protein